MRTVALLCMLGLCVTGSTVARAVPVTEARAETAIDLSYESLPADLSNQQTDGASASASNVLGPEDNRAESRARSVVGTDVGAYSAVYGFGGDPFPPGLVEATATARFTQQLTTTGVDPGVPFQVNVNLGLDGLLFARTTSNTSSTEASVAARVSVFDDVGESVLFDGSTRLFATGEQNPDLGNGKGVAEFEVAREGDFTDIAIDTSPVTDPTGLFAGSPGFTARFDTTVTTLDAVLTEFGDVFSVELWLRTRALLNGFEAVILADVFNTGFLELSVTDELGNPLTGVELVTVASPGDDGVPAPAPGTLALLAVSALGALGVGRGRAREGAAKRLRST